MIYTLYSFKGGVGRSMALANLGSYFCRKGLRVAMIDWDLEAPGLESYFYDAERNSVELARISARPGLIDILVEYKNRFPTLAVERRLERLQTIPAVPAREAVFALDEKATPPTAADAAAIREAEEVARITREFCERAKTSEQRQTIRAEAAVSPEPATFADLLNRRLTPLTQYLQSIPASGHGELWLLGAGARAPELFTAYADAVQDFDWLEFIASFEGKEYFEWLRRQLSAFDVALIDSRTGVTEMGGICTRLMADAVVAFCAPNNQNVDGVARIVRSLDTPAARNARLDRALEVLVIPTRLDDSESRLLGLFSDQFSREFESEKAVPERLRDLDRPLWNLQIPYIPKFTFRERLVIDPAAPSEPAPRADPPTQKLIKAYENIALHLAALADPNGRIASVFSAEIASAFPHLLPHQAPRMTPSLPGSWVERREESAALKETLLQCARAPKGGRLAIWGPAGVGKTTLLARACQDADVVAAFPGGIVWLTLDGAWGSDRVQEFLRAQFGVPRSGGRAALTRELAERRFLFVVDDVWTSDQLDVIFEFGQYDSRAIVTRDLGTAGEFSGTVFTVRNFTAGESAELLKIPESIAASLGADPSLNWLVEWPLGASLLRPLLERHMAQSQPPVKAWEEVRALLQRSGASVLDQTTTVGRNGSIDLSLRESLARLSPEVRRCLMTIAAQSETGIPIDPNELSGPQQMHAAGDRSKRSTYRSPGRVLVDLGLAFVADGKLRPERTVDRWLHARRELIGDPDEQRRQQQVATVNRGREIVRGAAAPLSEMESTAYVAKDLRAFSLARKLLALARRHSDFPSLAPPRRLKILQQHALCTYKDDDVVADERFAAAFEILNDADLQSASPSQETLGLSGSIHKLRWRSTGRRVDLEHSLRSYQRGAEGRLDGDFGYTRINAAYVLDQLASLEASDFPDISAGRRRQAALLREEIVAGLPAIAAQPSNAWLKGEWWYGATMGEALFGLGRFSEARYWLREALALDPPAWQLESTTRQLSGLARAQGADMSENSEASRTVAMLVGDAAMALRALSAGKVGLALSGGGFRASLFHIGVLARLAEIDVLRHVEVLSCVSGGSIVGAHYYLEVRRLLRDKSDRDITREDYVDIVRRIERDFLAGVRRNLRVRLLAAWITNLRSLLVPGYTRTRRLGELFEKHIYARVQDGENGDRFLSAMQIAPKDRGSDFNPKLDNWRRAAKAPILLLNATTLNTGHVWQFAVKWMGEPPVSANSTVDSNDILRRLYYTEAPGHYRDVRLGQAVAASACVPGLFDPVEMNGLFPRRRVRLVDGGVHDNQGVAGLLEQECSVVLVSDASGQMNSEQTPSDEVIGVLSRTQNISMARIREAGFRGLNELYQSSALTGLMFLHLKKDLDVKHVDWENSRDPYDASANPGQTRHGATLTSYGMPKTIQALLAGLRTDLDTFSDAEAYALMLSGYRMAASEFPVRALAMAEAPREKWDFLAIEPTVDRATDYEPEHENLRRVLSAGCKLSLKVWRLRPVASVAMLIPALLLTVLAGFTVAVLLGFLLILLGSLKQTPYVGEASLAVAAAAIAYYLVLWFSKRKSLTTVATGVAMATVGWFVARLHLWLFEWLYRRSGAVRRRERIDTA